MRAVGVDGCPGGWLAVSYDGRSFEPRFHRTFIEMVSAYPNVSCIGVDVPIGLIADVPRGCDVAARRTLGVRSSSVFPAPDPRLLDATSQPEASARSVELTGKGVSPFAFGIFSKVAEVNAAMTPLLQNWIDEVHPEVSFYALNGGKPMTFSKGDNDGYDERAELLRAVLGLPIPTRPEALLLLREFRPERDSDPAAKRFKSASPDDLLDAIVAAWSAGRVANGVAKRLPEVPEVNEDGLRMEIVY